MSIEYTIDIQLTELGYEDILQPLDSSARETPCRSTSPDSLSDSLPQRFLVSGQRSNDGKEAAKHTSSASASSLSKTPAQGQHDEEAVRGSAKQDDSNKYVDCADTAQEDSTEMQVVLDDSDDSEVSEVYDEEEVDEEDEEQEEGLSYETGLSGDYRCSVCDLELPSKFKLQDHMNLHTGARPYCCAECGKRFCQIYNYRVHLRRHAQTKVHRLQCRICLRDFASQEELKAHQSRTHFESEFYECDLCKRIFTSLKACENHVQSHTCRPSVVCDLCGRKFSSQRSLARHRKMRCHRSFKCTDCTKTFTKKNALLKHSFSHLGLLPYTCIRCRCHFRLARLYRKHKCEPERVHCVACLREFLSQQDFQQHKKDTGCWGNQEPKGDEIRCLECGQRFDTSEELKKHAGAHQRVLKCAECGKGFRSALLLMSHMGGHAGNSPCLCQSCGLGFPHQQNYDSHLKTCGQTPQPASAPRKRQASKSSSSQTKQDNEKPESSNPTNTAATPAAVSNNPAVISDSPASPSNSSVAPVKDPCSPGPVTEEPPAGSGPSDGLWKLTLNKQPPPGVKLVVFLPVCAADGLTLPSEMSQTLPVPVVHGSPLDALPPVSGEHVGVKVALGASLNGPMNLATGVKRDPGWEAPLDLSKKFNSSKCALSTVPLLPVKSEPGEAEISGEANRTERQEFQNGKESVKTKPGETDDQGKRVFTPSSGLMIDIKKEAQAPDPAFDLWASSHGSGQLTDAEIKKEVDISRSAVVNISSEGKIK